MGRSSLLVVTACTECVYWLLVPRAIPGGSVLCAVTQVCSCEPSRPFLSLADQVHIRLLLSPVCLATWPADL